MIQRIDVSASFLVSDTEISIKTKKKIPMLLRVQYKVSVIVYHHNQIAIQMFAVPSQLLIA